MAKEDCVGNTEEETKRRDAQQYIQASVYFEGRFNANVVCNANANESYTRPDNYLLERNT